MTTRSRLTMAACLLALLAAAPLQTTAQKLSLKDIARVYSAGSGAISDADGRVSGYYFLYREGKNKRGEAPYALRITDENLEVKQTKRFRTEKGTLALGAAYNGEAICVVLHSPRERTFELRSYDRAGDLLGTHTTELTAKELTVLGEFNGLGDEDPSISFFHAVPKVGFVLHLPTKDKTYGFRVTMFDNDLDERWTVDSDPALAKYQFGAFLAASEGYVFTSGLERPKMLTTRGTRTRVYAHAVDGGGEVFAVDATTSAPSMIPTNAFYDPAAGLVTLAGMYYARDADPVKDNSTGLAIKRYDLSGAPVEEASVTWARAFGKIGRAETEHLKKGGSVYVHNALRRPDGTLAIVGEYYDRDVSALGIASAVLSGGRSGAATSSIYVQDLLIVELDSALALADAHLFAKPKHEVSLPAGASNMGPGVVAMYVKSKGGFDYAYSQTYAEDGGSLVAYASRRKKDKGLGREDFLNFVTYDPAAEAYATTDFRLETDATWIGFAQGQPGYIMVSEYDKKAKSLDAHLERVD